MPNLAVESKQQNSGNSTVALIFETVKETLKKERILKNCFLEVHQFDFHISDHVLILACPNIHKKTALHLERTFGESFRNKGISQDVIVNPDPTTINWLIFKKLNINSNEEQTTIESPSPPPSAMFSVLTEVKLLSKLSDIWLSLYEKFSKSDSRSPNLQYIHEAFRQEQNTFVEIYSRNFSEEEIEELNKSRAHYFADMMNARLKLHSEQNKDSVKVPNFTEVLFPSTLIKIADQFLRTGILRDGRLRRETLEYLTGAPELSFYLRLLVELARIKQKKASNPNEKNSEKPKVESLEEFIKSSKEKLIGFDQFDPEINKLISNEVPKLFDHKKYNVSVGAKKKEKDERGAVLAPTHSHSKLLKKTDSDQMNKLRDVDVPLFEFYQFIGVVTSIFNEENFRLSKRSDQDHVGLLDIEREFLRRALVCETCHQVLLLKTDSEIFANQWVELLRKYNFQVEFKKEKGKGYLVIKDADEPPMLQEIPDSASERNELARIKSANSRNYLPFAFGLVHRIKSSLDLIDSPKS